MLPRALNDGRGDDRAAAAAAVSFSDEQRSEGVDLLKCPSLVGTCVIVKHEELLPGSSSSQKRFVFFPVWCHLHHLHLRWRVSRLFRSWLSRDDAVVPLETYTRSVLSVLQGQECQLFPFDHREQQFRFLRVNVPTLCTCLLSSSYR